MLIDSYVSDVKEHEAWNGSQENKRLARSYNESLSILVQNTAPTCTSRKPLILSWFMQSGLAASRRQICPHSASSAVSDSSVVTAVVEGLAPTNPKKQIICHILVHGTVWAFV